MAEGRDIGTVVAPQAAVKVFLTASEEARARRRSADLAADPGATPDGDPRRAAAPGPADAPQTVMAATRCKIDSTALAWTRSSA